MSSNAVDGRRYCRRKLIGLPTILQCNNNLFPRNGRNDYWESLLDLLLVGSACAITDIFSINFDNNENYYVAYSENKNYYYYYHWLGRYSMNFWMYYFHFMNGWMVYTYHITSRFDTNRTFIHHAIGLFIYVSGTTMMIVNTNTTRKVTTLISLDGYTTGAILQRFVILWILISISSKYQEERIQSFCRIFGIINCSVIICLVSSAWWGKRAKIMFSIIWLWIAIFFDLSTDFILSSSSSSSSSNTMRTTNNTLSASSSSDENNDGNIDVNDVNDFVSTIQDSQYVKNRLDTLFLLMLGSNIITTITDYREFKQQEDTIMTDILSSYQYYYVFFFSLIILYFTAVFYFTSIPIEHPSHHALVRRPQHGYSCPLYLLFHKLLCGSILGIGIAIKVTIRTITSTTNYYQNDEYYYYFVNTIWSSSIGGTIFFSFCIRLLHYFNDIQLCTTNNDDDTNNVNNSNAFILKWMYQAWWIILGISSFLPFVLGSLLATYTENAMTIVASYAILITIVTLLDCIILYYLEHHFQLKTAGITNNNNEETRSILRGSITTNTTQYQSI